MNRIIKVSVIIFSLVFTGCAIKTEKTPTTTYSNPELEFAVDLPDGWIQSGYSDMRNNPDYVAGVIDIEFSNMPQPEEGFNTTNFPESFERIDLRVFDINAEPHNYSNPTAYYQEFLPLVDNYERETSTMEVTKYKIEDDKYLILYVTETEETYESSSVVHADALYKGENYAYRFSNIFDTDKVASRQLIEEVMKPLLETFQILN